MYSIFPFIYGTMFLTTDDAPPVKKIRPITDNFRYSASVKNKNLYIVACRPVAKQQPRNKQLYNSIC
jgi:hypothetical protein